MKNVTILAKRKIVRKDAKFFDDVTDILREEGYQNHWHDFREKMHVVFDENEALKAKVEEMQKALEWYADENNYEMVEMRISEYSSETTSATWTDSGERARQALKGVETK